MRPQMFSRARTRALLVLFTLGAAAHAARADLWVAKTGSDSNAGTEAAPFLSIQAAVDAAPAEGCTIHVAEGTYYVKAGTSPTQLLEITKPVRIVATGSRANTVIDAENKRRNTWVNCDGALLAGFTIRRGKHSAWNSFGGVRVTAGVVSNCVIEANESYHFDGAFVDGGTLTHCVVRNNTTGTNVNGQGVRISKGLVANCEIYGQTSKYDAISATGAGLYAEGGVVTNCYIHDNCLGKASRSNERGSTSIGNSAGGVRILGSARVTDCVIEHNGVSGCGAGVHISAGTLDNSLVVGNETTNVISSACGAVYVTGGTVTNCTIVGNKATARAEGLHQTGGTVRDCIVFGNGRWDYLKTGGTSENVCTNNPGFVDAIGGDYRLTSATPCPGAGYRPVPVAGFGCAFEQDARVLLGNAGADVTFTATSANAAGGVTYTWDFGDGASATGATAVHHYAPGTYSVRLSATDASSAATSSAAGCVVVRPDKVYVSKTGSATFPYTTPETATADVYAALDLHPLEVEIHAGTYDISKCPLMLAEPIAVRGVGGRENVILDAKTDSSRFPRCAYVVHDDAFLSGVTLYRGSGQWCSGIGAAVTAGVVSNCWLRDNTSHYSPAFVISGTGAIVDSLVSGESCGGNDTYAGAGMLTGGSLIGCTIQKNGTMNGTTCRGMVWVNGASALVSNCVVRGNVMGTATSKHYGGGVFLQSGLVVNTVISNNTTAVSGGGVHMTGGTLRNCLVAGNVARASAGNTGGGIHNAGGAVENCTVLANTAAQGGGLYQTSGSTVNSVVYYNTGDDVDLRGGTVSRTASMPAATGEGNFSSEPAYLDYEGQDYRYTSLATAFIDTGTALPWMDGAQDLAGNARVGGAAPDIGAIEYYPSADEPFIATFSAPAVSAKLTLDAAFTAAVSKYDIADCAFAWDFGDGMTETKQGVATAAHTYAAPGAFTVTLTVTPPAGATDAPATVVRAGYITVIPRTCYVSTTGGNRFPYENWANASTSVPDAIAVGSDEVVVTNGTYSFPSIIVMRPLRIASVNGPWVTTFKSSAAGSNLVTLGDDGAWLEGFTLRDATIADWNETSGGSGLRITAGTATNCIVRNCQKYSFGNCYVGGTGRIYDSLVINNREGANSGKCAGLYVTGSGFACGVVATNNVAVSLEEGLDIGGAGLYIDGGTVTNCVFADNESSNVKGQGAGGKIRGGLVTHCVFTNNYSAGRYGGVHVYGGTIRNCLIAGNRATGTSAGYGVGGLMLTSGVAESLTIVGNESSLDGGGVRQTGGVLLNTIVYGNVSPLECDVSGGVRTNCLSTVAMAGEGCQAGDPIFTAPASGDYTVSALSPAKDHGLDQPWMAGGATDLAGNPRLQGESVDIGAYETDASAAVPFSAAFATTASEKIANGNTVVTFGTSVVGATGAVTYHWEFGDGATLTTSEATCSHAYAPGAYTVTLRVHDAGTDEWADDVVRENYAVALPDTCYVAQGEGVTPTYPYVSPETGAPGLKEALATGVGEIVVCPGTYTISETVAVGTPVSIRGATGNPADAVIYAPAVDGLRVMNLQSAGAVVSGLTLRGGMVHLAAGDGGSVLYMTGGMATNCVLERGDNYYKGAVTISNGQIVDCVIRNNTAAHSTQEASALTLYGGVVDRCVITGNVTTASINGSTRGEAVTLAGEQAVLRNSLVAWNIGHEAGGVRIVNAMEFSNCTIATNKARVKCAGVRAEGRPLTCANNIVWGNVAPSIPNVDNPLVFTYSCGPELIEGVGNTGETPRFKPAGGHAFQLHGASPLLNAGFRLNWMDGARDLVGRPRILGNGPAMGCYEVPYSAGALFLMR